MLSKLKNTIYTLLRRSEKYTKTDMVYLAKGGFWLTFGQMISVTSAFLLAIAFANLLPKETYGIYKYILSITSLLTIITLPGISTALIRAVAQGYEGSFNIALKTRIKWGLLASIVSLILSAYYYFNGNNILTISFIIIAIFLPFMDPLSIYVSFLNGKKLFKKQSLYNIITHTITSIAIVLVLFLTNNIFLILLTYFAIYTIVRSIFFWLISKKFITRKESSKEVISYGKHLSLMSIISTVANQLDKILIFHYLGAAELAIYFFAIAPPEQIKNLLKNIPALAFPKFSIKNKGEIKNNILNKMLRFAIPITLIVAIYIILAPFIFQIFFNQYAESVRYSQIFSISLITAIASLPVTALQAQGAKKQLYKLNSYVPIIKIALLFVLLTNFGLMGAILTMVINRFIILIYSTWLIKKI